MHGRREWIGQALCSVAAAVRRVVSLSFLRFLRRRDGVLRALVGDERSSSYTPDENGEQSNGNGTVGDGGYLAEMSSPLPSLSIRSQMPGP